MDNFEPSEEQNKIINLNEGYHCVLAPPGSGKTEILSNRVYNICNNSSISKICLTFTTKAAQNMEGRVYRDENSKNDPKLFIGNFHSYCYYFLLKNNLIPKYSSIIDEEDRNDLLRECIFDELQKEGFSPLKSAIKKPLYPEVSNKSFIDFKNLYMKGLIDYIGYLDTIDYTPFQNIFDCLSNFYNSNILLNSGKIKETEKSLYRLGNILSGYEFIQYYVNVSLYLKSIDIGMPMPALSIVWDYVKAVEYKTYSTDFYTTEERNDESLFIELNKYKILHAINLYKKYEQLKKRTLSIDFNDLIIMAIHYISENKERYKYCDFDWIQVDEAQDLNQLQWEILKRISNAGSHIVIFGDIGQSIYSFIGGDYERLLLETKNWDKHELTLNYRSPENLLIIFNEFISSLNQKNLPTCSLSKAVGKNYPSYLLHFETDEEQDKYIVNKVLNQNLLHDKEISNIAILTRTNKEISSISNLLSNEGINHFCISNYDLFKLRNTKDFISYLGIIENPLRRSNWYRIFKIYARIDSLKKSRKIIDKLYKIGINPIDFLNLKKNYSDNIFGFLESIHNKRYVIFDTETTGLDTKNDDIIQIAAIAVENNKIVDKLNLFIRTEKSLNNSTEIHKITEEFLAKNGIQREQALRMFFGFVRDSTLIAHNLNYDWDILKSNVEKSNLKNINFDRYLKFDSLKIAIKCFSSLNSYKLEKLLEEFNLEGNNSHNALDDVIATQSLVEHIKNTYTSRMELIHSYTKKYKKEISNFRLDYSDTYEKLLTSTTKESYTSLYNNFKTDLENKKINYKWEHDYEIQSKLLKHMMKISSDSPINLVKKSLRHYAFMKESDLIMKDDKLVVSTIHAAKGLEFDTVIIPSVIKNKFPHYFAKNRQSILEELRIFYVGMTRAKMQLILTSYEKININGYYRDRDPSWFIRPIRYYLKYYSIKQCKACGNFYNKKRTCRCHNNKNIYNDHNYKMKKFANV
jgi:DNA helicase-2/ATP-dependent DNA helicase PcrA